MKRMMLIPLVGLVSCCVGVGSLCNPPVKSITTHELLASPFGHDGSIASFRKHLPKKTKVVKLIQRNVQYPEKVDTIYSFNYKGSRIAILKTQLNREMLLGGSIRNKEILLANGVAVGMRWAEVSALICDMNLEFQDTITLHHALVPRKFTFYFDSKGSLRRYTFQEHGNE